MHLYDKAKMYVENFARNKSLSFIFYSIVKIINRRISLPQFIFKNDPTHFFDEKFLVRYMSPKNQGCFIDVGAHIGVWTFFLADKGVEVHAFEPSPNSRRILRMKAEKFPNVYVYPYALGEKHYTAELNLHSSSMVDSLVKKSDDFCRQIKVAVKTLDSFDLGNVGLIKVDTEGYEIPVLLGAKKTIQRNKPRLIIEVHKVNKSYQEELKTITEFLKELNYHWIILLRSPRDTKEKEPQPYVIADPN